MSLAWVLLFWEKYPVTCSLFLLDNQDSYPHCIHRDELHIPAQHLHKFDRDDVYRFDNLVELTSCMLLHTSHLLLVATYSFLFLPPRISKVTSTLILRSFCPSIFTRRTFP